MDKPLQQGQTGLPMVSDGAYPADRAAALSGVPKSTIHHWVRRGILVPSVSQTKVKLWSFRDLLSLRLIHWLRQPRHPEAKPEAERTTMGTVRSALARLQELDMELFDDENVPTVLVDRLGEIYLVARGRSGPPIPRIELVSGQTVAAELIDLIVPFEGAPHLLRPSTFVRIQPRKLSGAPHVVGTRVESQALYTLKRRGFSREGIACLYPDLGAEKIDDALSLEESLEQGALKAA